MQTLSHYMVTRSRKPVNVWLVTVLLLLSRENASPESNRSSRRIAGFEMNASFASILTHAPVLSLYHLSYNL